MTWVDRQGDAVVFACTAEECGRTVQLRRGALMVIIKGDPTALHGSGVGLQVSVSQ